MPRSSLPDMATDDPLPALAADLLGHPVDPAATRRIDEGTTAHVLMLTDGRVVHAARNAAGADALARQASILPVLPADLPCPRLLAVRPGGSLTTACPGQPLTRRHLLALPESRRTKLLTDLAGILARLHAVPVAPDWPAAHPPADPEWWDRFFAAIETRLMPRLIGSLRHEARAMMAACRRHPLRPLNRLIHGDLHPDHILADPGQDRITGLIDFGAAGPGDPAIDLAALLYNYGDAVLAPLLQAWPEAATLRPRADAYAASYEWQWALHPDPDWRLFALGAAKGFQPI